jgi:hypothetical protein
MRRRRERILPSDARDGERVSATRGATRKRCGQPNRTDNTMKRPETLTHGLLFRRAARADILIRRRQRHRGDVYLDEDFFERGTLIFYAQEPAEELPPRQVPASRPLAIPLPGPRCVGRGDRKARIKTLPQPIRFAIGVCTEHSLKYVKILVHGREQFERQKNDFEGPPSPGIFPANKIARIFAPIPRRYTPYPEQWNQSFLVGLRRLTAVAEISRAPK